MERKTTPTIVVLYTLVILCFIILLCSACSGQASLPAATAFHTPLPATLSPLPTNAPRSTNTPKITPTATDTPVPPTATMEPPLDYEAMDREATATMQTLVASLPQTATAIVQNNQAIRPSIVIPEAWIAVRAVLPSDILVYMPTYIPARFGSPYLDEVMVRHPLFPGPVYTISYYMHMDDGDPNLLVFILNNGKGSLGAQWAGPGTKKSITVDGESGELRMVPEQYPDPSRKLVVFYAASWKKQGQIYVVSAISSRLTEAEFMQIVHSVVQLKK